MSKVTIIAEAGVNHNGSLEMALRLVEAAAAAGVDVVKFQTFQPEKLAAAHTRKAEYSKATTDAGESQLAMLRRLELRQEDHPALMAAASRQGLEFLSTPFETESLEFLCRIGVRRMKIPSGEITNPLLLLAAGRSGLPIILSTGMATLGEIEQALGVLAFGMLGGPAPSRAAFAAAYGSAEGQARLGERVTLLHCTTEYPCPFEDVNLRAMDTLAAAFGLPVGYSDHTPGIHIAVAAAARGARVIEKHFTLDRNLPGPDHRASLEPVELAEMVRGIRQVEQALGRGRKLTAPSEQRNLAIARKSLVAATAIRAGELFTERNLTVKRPGSGLSPYLYWDRLGEAARREYQPDDLVE